MQELTTTPPLQTMTWLWHVRQLRRRAHRGSAAGQLLLQQLWPPGRAPAGPTWLAVCLRKGQGGRQPAPLLPDMRPLASSSCTRPSGQDSSHPTIQGIWTDGAEPRGTFAHDSNTGSGLNFLEALKLPVNVSIIFPLFIFVAVRPLQKWPARFKTAPD